VEEQVQVAATHFPIEASEAHNPASSSGSSSLIARLGVEMLQKYNQQKSNDNFLTKMKNVVMETVFDKIRGK